MVEDPEGHLAEGRAALTRSRMKFDIFDHDLTLALQDAR
jgi:hypothetical protein